MFSEGDAQYLLRALSRNRLILFAGAGFAAGAKNRIGTSLPVGSELARLIWKFLEYDGGYDSTPLPEMFEALLSSGTSHTSIRNFLEDHLICNETPAEYSALSVPYWYRIYTTNVDDLIPRIYSQIAPPALEILAYPDDDILERDQSLGKIQLIYLNGRLPCPPEKLTFGARQYARGALDDQPLYEQFIRDYATHPVIFVGTNLNEPLLWQHIESRERRMPDASEHRPKSFMISPRISQPKRAQLEQYNIVPVEGSTLDLLDWIKKNSPGLPSRIDVIKAAAPGIAEILSTLEVKGLSRRRVAEFAECFVKVPLSSEISSDRSLYLLGTTPRWEDMHRYLDAPRTLTDSIFAHVVDQLDREAGAIVAVLGTAGCGKSTILRRLGIRLSQAGRDVFFTNSERVPSPGVISDALEALVDRKSILLFDNAEIVLAALPGILKDILKSSVAPIVIIASRTNDFDRLWARFQGADDIKEFHVPNLDRTEIKGIINVLERNSLLGKLQGMPERERIREFENRAGKQILVAMREATSGYGFDEIIKDEFDKLVPQESKVLYLCVALATDAGYTISREQFVRCTDATPGEALHLLTRNLHDIVIPFDQAGDFLKLRHQHIAEYVIERVAPRPLLRDAYIRLLTVLSAEIGPRSRRSRAFGIYRDVINHLSIYRRFAKDMEEARSIYSSLSRHLQKDAQFWLQWGSLELEGGSLELAENYLDQAESLDDKNHHIKNARAHLLIKKGLEASDLSTAGVFFDDANKILTIRMTESSYADVYAIHIYCYYGYHWVRRWFPMEDNEQRTRLEELRRVADEGCKVHPRHQRVKAVKEGLDKAYFYLALPRDQRPLEPTM
jgi:tetratricopeptide (TPR) repeat protein